MKEETFFDKEKVKDKSKKQEKKIAKDIGGKTTLASGALHFNKADVFKRGLRIECKRTDKQSLILEKNWFEKIRKQCLNNEIPVLNVQIQDEDWFLIRPSEFEYIRQCIEEDRTK